MTALDDLDRQLDAYLRDGPTELPEPSFHAVRDRTESARQRAVIGPWRMPDTMNKLVTLGLGAAAVVVALVIGTQVLGPPAPGGVGTPASASPSPSATPTAATPSPAAGGGLPQGPFLITGDDGAVNGGTTQITVEITTPGWTYSPEMDYVGKNDDGKDAPESVGAALLAWAWPAGTGFNVYGDPCRWTTTIPATPATTAEEIAADFAAQASRDATTPMDVTVGGYAGKTMTLHTPMSFYIDAGATREEEFAACDNSIFAQYGTEADETVDARNAQGPGQIDELWILDVNGTIVIIDAAYSPATPADLVDELRALAESATFE